MAIHVDIGSIQFENANSLRAYPFAEDSSLLDKTGKALPQDAIVDIHMVVPAGLSSPSSGADDSVEMPVVRLSSVHLSSAMVSACFTSYVGGRISGAASVIVAADSFRPYIPYRLEKLAGYEDIGGIVSFGDIAFPSSPETYFMDEAVVHPCCVAAAKPPALRRFIDPRSGEVVSGDARISFSEYVDALRRGRDFSLSLREGAYQALASKCAGLSSAEICGATPIVSINGVRPDSEGNIVLWFH